MTPPAETARRHLAAVLFVDVAGYTELAARQEDRALRLIGVFQAVTKEIVPTFGGTIVKFLGDGALAVFDSADHAVRAALALQRAFPDRAASVHEGAQLDAGVHLGEIVTATDEDAYGDGVNVASRLLSEAGPGQVLVSEDVWRQLRRREDFTFDSMGAHPLKGLAEPMEIYEADLVAGASLKPASMETPAETRESAERSRRHPLGETIGAVIVGIIFIVLTLDYVFSRGEEGDGGQPATGAEAIRLAALPAAPVVAVLPFANLSPDPEAGHFGDGMTEDIIARLAQINDLKVISRTSAMQYRETDKALTQIGDELGADVILEGSVRQAGDRIRIVVQLINADTDIHLWSETYDRDLADLFAIQTEVAERIAAALRIHLSEDVQDHFTRMATDDFEAYRLLVKGRSQWNKRTPEGLFQAVEDFSDAIGRDPGWALAYGYLAQTYLLLPEYAGVSPDSARNRAERAARLALEIDPDDGGAHLVMGALLRLRRDWEGAERAYVRALEILPGDATAHHWYAWFLVSAGRFDEAIAEILVARELDPKSRIINSEVGDIYISARRFDEAIEELRSAIEVDAGFPQTWQRLAWAYELSDRFEEAVDAFESWNAVRGGAEFAEQQQPDLDRIRAAYRARGEAGYWDAMITLLERTNVPASFLASTNAQAGNIDEAFRWLDRIREPEESHVLAMTKGWAYLDPLHDDPRWNALLARLGLDRFD